MADRIYACSGIRCNTHPNSMKPDAVREPVGGTAAR